MRVVTQGPASSLRTTGSAVDVAAAAPPTAGKVLTATDATHATWQTPSAGYTDEQAQDAVGSILSDAGDIDFTYDDGAPSISGAVKADAITYAKMQNVTATDKVLGRSTAGAGDVEEIACTAAGRALLAAATAAAQEALLAAVRENARVMRARMWVQFGSTTAVTFGYSSAWTASAAGGSTGVMWGYGWHHKCTSLAVISNGAGFAAPTTAFYRIGVHTVLDIVFSTDSDVANARFVAGMASDFAIAEANGDNMVCFEADSVLNSNMRWYLYNKGSGSSSNVDSGVAIAANRTYRARFVTSPGSVVCSLWMWSGGVWSQIYTSTVTTNLPADTTSLAATCQVVSNEVATAKVIHLCEVVQSAGSVG